MVLGGVWGSVPVQHLCLVGPGPSQGRGVHRVSVWTDVSPSTQLSELAEDALLQLPVPAELAQKVLQALEKRLQGSAQSELRSSRVYAKYLPGSGAEQRGGGSATVSSEGDDPRAVPAEVAKEELSAATALRSDSQLFCELLEREGLRFPQAAEQSEGEGPTEGGCGRWRRPGGGGRWVPGLRAHLWELLRVLLAMSRPPSLLQRGAAARAAAWPRCSVWRMRSCVVTARQSCAWPGCGTW